MRSLHKLCKDERGATAVEYALIMALIFLAMISGVIAFGQATITMWTNVSEEVRTSRNN